MKRVLLCVSVGLMGLFLVTLVQSSGLPLPKALTVRPATVDPVSLRTLQARYKTLAKQLTQLMPTQPYILVDTAPQTISILSDRIRLCWTRWPSTGSGTILDKPGDSKRQWIFDTPRGEFAVQSRLANPVWVSRTGHLSKRGSRSPRARPTVLSRECSGNMPSASGRVTLFTGRSTPASSEKM
ncbi:hypothetical protein EMGBD2_12160 [Nitrospirota bacterium]|nr:hypothetical protein EMGBD2_12160 [Nitrospirota bacterium]